MIKVKKRKVKNAKKISIKKFQRVIICPFDGKRHIDKGKFALIPHKRHLCVITDPKTGKKIKHFFNVNIKSIGV